jgi:hypothetical protein
VSYTIPVIGAGTVETSIWEGAWTLQWGACLEINKDDLQVPAGSLMKIYLTVTRDGSADLGFITANWGSKLPTGHEWSKSDNVLGVPAGTTSLEIVLTAELFQAMQSGMNTWNNTWVMLQGDGAIISRVSIITKGSSETDLWKGSAKIDWNTSGGLVPVDVSLLAPGKTLGLDFVCDGASPVMRYMTGSWWIDFENWQPGGNHDIDPSETNIEFVITQTDIDNIKMQGNNIHVGGQDITIKRLYIK